MIKKTQRNTTKFISLNFIAHGFNGDLNPKLDLAGKINQEIRSNKKKRNGLDLAGFGPCSVERGPVRGPCARAKRYGPFLLPLDANSERSSAGARRRRHRRLRWTWEENKGCVRESGARETRRCNNGGEGWSVQPASWLDMRLPERKGMKMARWIRGFIPRFLVLRWSGRRGGAYGGLRSVWGGLHRRRGATAASAVVCVRGRNGESEREGEMSEGAEEWRWSASYCLQSEACGRGERGEGSTATSTWRRKHGGVPCCAAATVGQRIFCKTPPELLFPLTDRSSASSFIPLFKTSRSSGI